MFEKAGLSVRLAVSGILATSAPILSAEAPVAVSPGFQRVFAGVATPCPTFSWSAVENAAGYELVVYETASGPDAAAVAEPGKEPALKAAILANATAWTPPVGDCLAPGGSYAWTVRARDAHGVGEWSPPALFRVDLTPLLPSLGAGIERALAEYLEARGVAFEPDGGLAALLARELAGSGTSPAGSEADGADGKVYGGGARYSRGRAVGPEGPLPKFVAGDEVELWLQESGTTSADFVQLIFATPDYDGDPTFGDAWNLGVVAQTGSLATGRIFLSSPSGSDVFQADPVGVGFDPPIFRVPYLELPDIVRLIPKVTGSRPICSGTISNDEGRLYYDDTGNDLCYCDGTSWRNVDGDAVCP